MELAGQNMVASLLPGEEFLPVWNVGIKPDMTMVINDIPGTKTGSTHDIGRWWDAMLRLEAATGFTWPQEVEDAMLAHFKGRLSRPLGLAGNSASCDDRKVDYHSQREILLSLAALVTRRQSEWAAEAGSRLVRTLDRFILPGGQWDLTAMGIGDTPTKPPDVRAVYTHGRMIEGLLAFYQATYDAAALDLAGRLADWHFTASTRPGGAGVEREYYPDLHTHSLLGTYRGLLQYGILTRQAHFVERVAQTYNVTVRQHIKLSGFVSHDWGKDRLGETSSPGDAAQLALWLAQQGHSEFLDDAERMVRARILPSQITEPLGVRFADGDAPAKTDPESLVLGAFGGVHLHPHGGKRPTPDVTAADLHTLCDIHDKIIELTDNELRVNFHFDHKANGVEIACRVEGTQRELEVRSQSRRNVFVRIPRWVDQETVSVSVNGKDAPLLMAGDYACISGGPDGNLRAVVKMDLPVRRINEWTNDTDYEFTWLGDTVQGITPNDPLLPFYPTT